MMPVAKPSCPRLAVHSFVTRLSDTRILLLALIPSVLALVLPPMVRMDAPKVYAIKDAQIVTGTGKNIAKGTVVIRDGLITDIGESAKVPADAQIINGAGMTIYPGLIDAYTNLGFSTPTPAQPQVPGAGGGRQAAIAAAAAGQQPNPEAALGDPAGSAADQVRPGGTAIEDARAAGVTAALSSSRQGIFAGQSALINLAGENASRLVVRSPVALTVQFTSGGGFGGGYPGSLMGTVAYIRQTFYDAIHYRDEMQRYERVKRGVSRPDHNKRLAALQPALRGELPVLFVANSDGDIRRALMISDEFKLKPIIAGALYGYRVADVLKAKNVPVILSVDFPRRSADLPEDEDEPLRVLRDRAEVPKGPARLAQAGVRFAFTSGTLRPQEFIANVQRAVENGLPKDEAIRALTINAAEILGASEQLGSVEVGKIANLVVASGDLLSRDAKIRHVFIDGAEVDLTRRSEAPAQRGFGPGGRGGAAATIVDPSGSWDLQVTTPHGDLTVRLSLQREGDRITGSLSGPTGTNPVQNATLNGNQIRFTVAIQMGGETSDASFSGTIEGDTIRGTVSLAALGSMEFTGTRPR